MADQIRTELSSFYDAAFMDPTSWGKALPGTAWAAFDPSIRAQAQRDVDSLTLGSSGATMKDLAATQSTLKVDVLYDPSGHANAVIAEVLFEATGTTKDGQAVLVSNQGSFLFSPVTGGWLITGYPGVHTDVTSPSPSPSPSSSSSPSATP